jgi:hypothetical protein
MKTLRRISKTRAFASVRILTAVLLVLAAGALLFLAVSPPASAQPTARMRPLTPKFSAAVAFDVSPALRNMVLARKPQAAQFQAEDESDSREVRPEREFKAPPKYKGHTADKALQSATRTGAPAIPAPSANFEGLSNLDNFNIFGFRVNPPDPNGDVGPNHIVEIINLVFAVYDKSGSMLLGPADTGALWSGFAVPDCTDPSGDPVVLYDQLADRWILSQFTTRGMNADGSFNGLPFYNCVAVSQTGDPTGAYFRYAFITSQPDLTFFPDYPKYGVWTDSYVLTSRDFGPTVEYGISVYALEKNKMVNGQPNARAVHFFIDGNDPDLLPLVGDGLLPADIDGKQKPKTDTAIPIVGTQDDNAAAVYGGTFDAINIWDLRVHWNVTATASLTLNTQLPTAAFDSIFPCGTVAGTLPPSSRDCLPQPGITNGSQYLDILSYRQRPTFRLAYRNFKDHESLVTNQSVEALPGVAGVRWYEIRRDGAGNYSLYQQGTYAPTDGVHRWMGSAAMDKKGDIALGYSVVNGTDVFPGIRYTGRLSGDPLGQMTLGEGVIKNGAGVQTTTNSRWGDYTSMNVDPTDDCTFWYVDEYYQVSGVPLPPPPGADTRPWQTRIASFKLPGCQ